MLHIVSKEEETYWLKQLINDPVNVAVYKLPREMLYLLWDITFYNPDTINTLPKDISISNLIDCWTQKQIQKDDICGFIKDAKNKWICIGTLRTIQELIRGHYYNSTSKRVMLPGIGIYINPSYISWFKL